MQLGGVVPAVSFAPSAISARIWSYVKAPTWRQTREFLVRRRIFLSILLFAGMVIEDVTTGVVPRDPISLSDRIAFTAIVVVCLGLAIRSWAAGYLIKNARLTTTGPYALVRNPLYLGSFLMILGFCALINDRENIWIVLVVFPFLYVPQVAAEERYLKAKFGRKWIRYSNRAGRFFPRRLVRPRFAGWRLTQWMKSREYNALLTTVAGLAALKLLHEWRT
jgi:protein-S-isoprenylcysteine O-methyltransferase Ste14